MNYLEFKIPIKKNAEWFVTLRNAMASEGIPVKWESGSFHITAVFIYDDQPVEELKSAFSRRLTGRKAPSLTLDKLDAFTTKNDIIVNATASQLSESLAALIEEELIWLLPTCRWSKRLLTVLQSRPSPYISRKRITATKEERSFKRGRCTKEIKAK